MSHILTTLNVKTLNEIWPNFKIMAYAGLPITRHRKVFEKIIGHPLCYVGLYLATEAPLGFAPEDEEYVFFLGDILFSFNEEHNQNGKCLGIHEVEVGQRYLLNIGVPNGFLQYQLKDIIEITQLSPYPKFNIVGRKGVGISIAYEKYAENDMERVINDFCRSTKIPLSHYFLCPAKNAKDGDCYEFTFALPHQDVKHFEQKIDLLVTEIDRHLMVYSNHYSECRLRDKLIDAPRVNLISDPTVKDIFMKKNTKGQFKMKSIFKTKGDLESYLVN